LGENKTLLTINSIHFFPPEKKTSPHMSFQKLNFGISVFSKTSNCNKKLIITQSLLIHYKNKKLQALSSIEGGNHFILSEAQK